MAPLKSPLIRHFPAIFAIVCAGFCLFATPLRAVSEALRPLSASLRAPTNAVRIASEGARPPYNYLDANNELAGFEIDLGNALCAKMQVSCTFVAQEWDAMIPRLLSHHYDAIMAAMEISDERQKDIAFSIPYLRMPSAFIAARKRQISDPSPTGLAGRIIGVEADGPHQAWLEENYKTATIRPYASLVEAVLDLSEGRIDVALGDKDAILDLLKNRREAACCKFLADVPRDPAFFGEGIAVGMRKEDTDLKAAFDKAIEEVVADGTYAAIRGKYFEFEVY